METTTANNITAASTDAVAAAFHDLETTVRDRDAEITAELVTLRTKKRLVQTRIKNLVDEQVVVKQVVGAYDRAAKKRATQ